jgi:peptidoglycan/xylan/chitin deacetylase (PgdA/CDA1 family)
VSTGSDPQWRRARREARRRERARRRRALAAGCVVVAIVAIVAVVALAGGGSPGTPAAGLKRSVDGAGGHAGRATATAAAHAANSAASPGVSGRGAGVTARGAARAPILMYHVINSPPAGAPFPGLYVTREEFSEQMRALAAAGYRAVTQDQLWANWREGARLPAGKPIVLSFDNGYQSQYTQALPVLRGLGWVGVENIQLTGLPPSQGGLSRTQVRGLVAAGWELDTQGISHADLTTLDAAALHAQVASARETIRREYGVPVNWFCYPSGQYDAMVLAAVKAAGYRGSTTVVPGWAQPGEDPYRLPRLRVLGGTSGAALVSEIAAIGDDAPPPPSYVTN